MLDQSFYRSARASETRIRSLFSSYSSDKRCVGDLAEFRQTGAKFNLTYVRIKHRSPALA
jgi:hypothetical protein